MSTQYQIVISAVEKGVKQTLSGIQAGFKTGADAVRVFNEASGKGQRIMAGLGAQVKNLVAAYVSLRSLSEVNRIMQESSAAAFSMQASVAAAAREFGNSGAVKDWEETIRRLKDEMLIYSETALQSAVSRTVDMTKRLGLEKTQMEEVIKRSGDLAAGKTDLTGAIERVTAALRGEAESSEYLGLTLNENYVKAWHEAHNVHQIAWKDLTDIQKAQVRYNVFLEQSAEMQGRGAESAKTFSGAIALIKARMTDAISGNENLTATLNDLAGTLRDNAGEIGNIISSLVDFLSWAIKIGVEWKGTIAILLGLAVVAPVIINITNLVKGLHAAVVVLSSTKLIAWLAGATTGMAALSVIAGKLLILFGAFKFGQWIGGFINELPFVQKAFQNLYAVIDITFSKIKIAWLNAKKVWNTLFGSQEAIDAIDRQIAAEQSYIDAVKKGMGIVVNSGKAAKTAGADMEKAYDGAIEKVKDILPPMERVKSTQEATTEEIKKFEKQAQEAYANAKKAAEDYGQKIADLNKGIADRQISLEDKIRELRRGNMSEEQAAADLKLQAIEKERAAQAALQKFRETGDQRQMELAREFAGDAEGLWSSYAGKSQRATEEAITGLKNVNAILDQADKIEIGTFAKLKKDAEDVMKEIQSWVDTFNQNAELKVPITLDNLAFVEDKIKDLVKDETKTIYIKTVEKKAAGGRVGMAAGGRFPGNSTIDSIPVLARPGEGFVRNEALNVWDRLFGTGFFHGINAPWSDAGRRIIDAMSGNMKFHVPSLPKPRNALAFAAGGRVPELGIRNLGSMEINMNGQAYPVMGRSDVLEELQAAVKKQTRLRRNK